MAGLSVVWNIVLAPSILKEQVTAVDVQAMQWIGLGCMLVGISGSHRVPHHSADELFGLFQETLFVVYIIIFAIACLVVCRRAFFYGIVCFMDVSLTAK